MSLAIRHDIEVNVRTEFLSDQTPYTFAYHITITNNGTQGAKLLTRHWFIVDGDHKQQEVKGDGVVGQQPYILPGSSYSYSSGCVLATPVGCMHGSYRMQRDDGDLFQAPIPLFSLRVPGAVN